MADKNTGKIVEIKGVVIDAVFHGGIPSINNALRIAMPEQEGRAAFDLIAEVQQHLGNDRVRGCVESGREPWFRYPATLCRERGRSDSSNDG